jgi:hypothetical protein
MDFNHPTILRHKSPASLSSSQAKRIANLKEHIDLKKQEFQHSEYLLREAYKRALKGEKSHERRSNGKIPIEKPTEFSESDASLSGSPTKLINERCENHYVAGRNKSKESGSSRTSVGRIWDNARFPNIAT